MRLQFLKPRLLLITLAAAGIVAVAWWRFPLTSEPPLNLSLLRLPWPTKLLNVVLTLTALSLFNLAALTLGRPLERRFKVTDHPVAKVLLRLALGFLILANAVLLLAALHLLIRPVLAALILVPAAFGLYQARHTLMTWKPPEARPGDWKYGLGAALFVGPMLGAFVPSYGWDAFVYHLAIPERFLFENGIWATEASFYSAFPLTVQMLYTLALAFDLEPVAQLLHWEFGALTALAIVFQAHRISPRAAALAFSLVIADSMFFWELQVAYADLPACFYGFLAAVLVAEARQSDEPGKARSALVLAGLFAGATVAIHYRMAVLVAGLLVALGWPTSKEPSPPAASRARTLALSFMVFGFAAGLVVAPWLLRNLLCFGNPVAPAAQSLFHAPGEEAFDPIVIAQSTELALRRGPGRDLKEFLLWPWRLTTGVTKFGSPLYGQHPAGSLYLVGLLACLLGGGWGGSRNRTLLRIFLVTSTLWFWSGAQESRYALPFLLLLTVPGGAALDRLLPQTGWTRLPLLAVLAFAMLQGQWVSLRHLPWNWAYAAGDLSPADVERQEPALNVGKVLRQQILGANPTEKHRLLLLFEGRAYFYRGLDYIPYHVNEGAETLQRVHQASDVADLRRRLEELGVTHILINRQSMQHYRTVLVPGYSQTDFDRDVTLIDELLARETRVLVRDQWVTAHTWVSRPEAEK